MSSPQKDIYGKGGSSDDEVPPATILAPSPLLTLAGFLVGLPVEWIQPTRLLPEALPQASNLAVGTALALAGGLMFGSALLVMRSSGKRPSHSDQPPKLITAGPFQWSRNPIYTGHSLIHLGASFFAGSLWTILTLVPVALYLRRVVLREEARLRRLFGEEYDRYCQEAWRWL